MAELKLKEAIIVDLGGTLAHRTNRLKSEYMERFHEDRVDETVRDLVNLINDSGVMVIILTGQRERSRIITEKWLKNNNVKFDLLFMKPNDIVMDTLDWKKLVYDTQIKGTVDIKFILEDREDTVEMWRNNKVKCFQTASGQDREYYKQNK